MMPRSTNSASRFARAFTRHNILVAAGFLVLLLVSLFPARWSALAGFTYWDAHVLQTALNGDDARLPDAARALVRDLRTWRVELFPAIENAPALGWLPYVGGDLEKLPQLAAFADETLRAVEPSLALYENLAAYLDAKSPGAALVAYAENNASEIERARAAVQFARAKYDTIDTRTLSPQMRAAMQNFREVLDEWDASLRLLAQMPQLLGAETERRYLILAQNSDELRPTGGYITAFGILQVTNGDIQLETFGDSLSADDLNLIHPPPPAPLQKYMSASQWLLRDSNWYAHFPTSADVAQSMYARDRGVRTDGVIAVDMRFMPLLVSAIPNLELDGVPLSSDNVISALKENWKPLPTSDYMTAEWFTSDRKNFLGALMQAVMGRVQAGAASPPALAQALLRGLRNKSVQLYFNDAELEQAVLSAGWGGAIVTGNADYLNVIDSNVGFNKVNARVTREIFYHVRLNEHGGDATVTLTYHNPSRPEGDACDLLRQHKDETYASMEQSCYWNYVRVLAPRFAQFVSAQGVADAGYADDVDVVTAFGAYLLVNRNTDAQVQFQYALPDSILQNNAYTLKLQSQAGAPATPIRVRVQYPARLKMSGATGVYTRIDDNTIEFQDTLTHDKTIIVYFDNR